MRFGWRVNEVTSPLFRVADDYPVVVVGGGILGAGLFREFSLHRTGCLLVDKGDFASQTSQSSSKMLHGGLRYLETFDFALVKEALGERAHWLRVAPHLCYSKRFYFPVFKRDARPLWKVKLGLWLYHVLAGFQGRHHTFVSRGRAAEIFPQLRRENLAGAGVYNDAIVNDAKLALEIIYDGLCFEGCQALNYVGLEAMEKRKGLWCLRLKDQLTGMSREIVAQKVVFATGPFSDQLFAKLKAFPWRPKLLPSKGSHLWIKREALGVAHPMILSAEGGRVIFVIPQGEKVLVGTTEVPVDEVDFDPRPSPGEVDYLRNHLKHYFPGCSVGESDIVGSFAGVRPLVRKGGTTAASRTSRVHKIFQPEEGIFVVMGGKYTTFRLAAADLAAPLLRQVGGAYNPQLSRSPLRVRSVVPSFQTWEPNQADIDRIIARERPRTNGDIIERRLGLLNADPLRGLKLL